jgi:hypothetical protein
VHALEPLRAGALRTVIEGPARLAGIGVDEQLVMRLVADTDRGEALPLLAYTLAQLADGVGHGGRLSADRYAQLGGVQETLARQADAALAERRPRPVGAASRSFGSCCGWSPRTSRAGRPAGGSATTSCPHRYALSGVLDRLLAVQGPLLYALVAAVVFVEDACSWGSWCPAGPPPRPMGWRPATDMPPCRG